MRVLRARLYQKALDERRARKRQRVGEKKAIEWGSQIRSYVLHPYQHGQGPPHQLRIGRHATGCSTGASARSSRRTSSGPPTGAPRVPSDAEQTAPLPWMDEVRGAARGPRAGSPEPPAEQRRAAVLLPALRPRRGAAHRPHAPHRDRRAPPRADLVSGRRAKRRTTSPRSRPPCARPRRSSASRPTTSGCSARSRPLATVIGLLRRAVRRRDPESARAAPGRGRDCRGDRGAGRRADGPADPGAGGCCRAARSPTLFYHHGAHVIWGATARMLKELLDALGWQSSARTASRPPRSRMAKLVLRRRQRTRGVRREDARRVVGLVEVDHGLAVDRRRHVQEPSGAVGVRAVGPVAEDHEVVRLALARARRRGGTVLPSRVEDDRAGRALGVDVPQHVRDGDRAGRVVRARTAPRFSRRDPSGST